MVNQILSKSKEIKIHFQFKSLKEMEKFPKKLNSKLLFHESTYFTSAIRSLSIKFLEILKILT
jgi:hypothetical protein